MSIVDRIDGCYYNVVGFPLNRFASEVAAFLRRVGDGGAPPKERKS